MTRWATKPKPNTRKTSRHFELRDLERDSGYTPNLFHNPIVAPIGHYVDRCWLWITLSNGHRRTATDDEEHAWANGTMTLPLVEPLPRPRRIP